MYIEDESEADMQSFPNLLLDEIDGIQSIDVQKVYRINSLSTFFISHMYLCLCITRVKKGIHNQNPIYV